MYLRTACHIKDESKIVIKKIKLRIKKIYIFSVNWISFIRKVKIESTYSFIVKYLWQVFFFSNLSSISHLLLFHQYHHQQVYNLIQRYVFEYYIHSKKKINTFFFRMLVRLTCYLFWNEYKIHYIWKVYTTHKCDKLTCSSQVFLMMSFQNGVIFLKNRFLSLSAMSG